MKRWSKFELTTNVHISRWGGKYGCLSWVVWRKWPGCMGSTLQYHVCFKNCQWQNYVYCQPIWVLPMNQNIGNGGNITIAGSLISLRQYVISNCYGCIRNALINMHQPSIEMVEKRNTVETLYNTVNFCWNTHKRHSIARPKGRGMGCLLWVQRATYCVDLSKLSSIKYLL